MNDQCMNCKIRKFCSRPEPFIDGACEDFVEEGTYVKWMDGPKQDAEPVVGFDPGAPEGDKMNVRLDWGERGPELIRPPLTQVKILSYAIDGIKDHVSKLGLLLTDKTLSADALANTILELHDLNRDWDKLEEEREKKLRGTADVEFKDRDS